MIYKLINHPNEPIKPISIIARRTSNDFTHHPTTKARSITPVKRYSPHLGNAIRKGMIDNPQEKRELMSGDKWSIRMLKSLT